MNSVHLIFASQETLKRLEKKETEQSNITSQFSFLFKK